MATGTGRRRVTLLFAVLAGLFLMHGISAPSMHGMPMRMSMPMSVPMPAPPAMSVPRSMPALMPAQMNSAIAAPMPAAPTVSGAVPAADHTDACETCVPLRPEGMAGLFLALFLIVITLWRPRLPHAPRPIQPRWPHGPPRTGVQTLRTLSISRT